MYWSRIRMTATTESNFPVGPNVVFVEDDGSDEIVELVGVVSFDVVVVVVVPLMAVVIWRVRVTRAGSSRPINNVVRMIARPDRISRQSSTLTSGELPHRRLVGRHADRNRKASMLSVTQSSTNSVPVFGMLFWKKVKKKLE